MDVSTPALASLKTCQPRRWPLCGARAGDLFGPRPLVHAANPGFEPRVRTSERLVIPEDPVEELVVALFPEERVLEERERGAVGCRELAEEVVASGEQVFELVEPRPHLGAELLD